MSTILRSICNSKAQVVTNYLRKAQILTSGQHLIDFMRTNRLADAGSTYYGKIQSASWHEKFLKEACNFKIILGSPMVTNADRRDKSVSACSIPPREAIYHEPGADCL